MGKDNSEKIEIKLSAKAKAIISIVVIIAVIVAGVIIVKANETYFGNKVLYLAMPKTITAEEMQTDFDLHVRPNSDYDSKKLAEQPLEAFEYYYTDPKTNEEVVIKGTEQMEINGDEIAPYLMFVLKARETTLKLQTVVKKAVFVIIALLIVAAIVVWYIVWSKKEDEQKAKKYKK